VRGENDALCLLAPAAAQRRVYRDPTPDGYQTVPVHTRGAVLSSLAFPGLELRWEEIFGQS
jgi:Uma2 family endonuclease